MHFPQNRHHQSGEKTQRLCPCLLLPLKSPSVPLVKTEMGILPEAHVQCPWSLLFRHSKGGGQLHPGYSGTEMKMSLGTCRDWSRHFLCHTRPSLCPVWLHSCGCFWMAPPHRAQAVPSAFPLFSATCSVKGRCSGSTWGLGGAQKIPLVDAPAMLGPLWTFLEGTPPLLCTAEPLSPTARPRQLSLRGFPHIHSGTIYK